MFVVYDTNSTVVQDSYPRWNHARDKAKRMNEHSARHGGPSDRYDWVHKDFHRLYVVQWMTRLNIMSGKTFLERSDTPYYCSPSSETYWSS